MVTEQQESSTHETPNGEKPSRQNHHIPFGLQHVGGNASYCPQVAAVLHCGESQKGPGYLGPSPGAGSDACVGAMSSSTTSSRLVFRCNVWMGG